MRLGLGIGLGFSGCSSIEEEDDLPTNRYLYIDGGCLRATIKTMLNSLGEGNRNLELDLPQMAGGYDRIFYYDAISAQDRSETIVDYRARIEREHEKFDKIRSFDSFHVILGEIKGRANKRQKRVDVNLAVDMMMHTFRKNMGSATLLAGDDDFIPLVEALVREGMKIRIWYPPQATSELLSAADHRQPISLKHIYGYLTNADGTKAYEIRNGGQGSPHGEPVGWQWSEGEFAGAVQQEEDYLRIWYFKDGQWNWNVLGCPQSSVEAASKVFSAIVGVPIYGPNGENFSWSE